MNKYRRLRNPGIAAFILFWILISLGVWQAHRRVWKEGILAQIHAAEIAPPIPLPAQPTRFEKVSIAGHWVAGKAVLYSDEVHDSPQGPIEGGELVMPFQTDAGPVVLVDLGWVPQKRPQAMAMPAGETQAVGYIHQSDTGGWFAGTDDVAHGLYYTLNTAKIGADMGLANVAPFALVAMGPLPPPGSPLPEPAQNLPRPPNNHYQYELTWFGFALVLVFEFFFYARKRLREP
jgi:surfeit locus 1 family protein